MRNPLQVDSDVDFIGDDCDHDAAQNHRVRFDSFEELEEFWISGALQWRAIDDAASPLQDTLAHADLWHLKHRPTGTSWWIEIGFTIGTADGRYGILGRNTDGSADFPCYVERGGGKYRLLAKSAVVDPIPDPAPGVHTLRLRRETPAPPGLPRMHCELDGAVDATTIDNVSTGTQAGITSSAITQFTYIDIITTAM